MYVEVPNPKLDSLSPLPIIIPPSGNQPLQEGSTSTSNLTPHIYSPTHRMVHGNSENVLDYYRSIQLPLPLCVPTCSVPSHGSCTYLKTLTHPSELGKKSRRSSSMSRNHSNKIEKVKGEAGAVGFSFMKERKRKSVDYPNVFDHLAVLCRKQQKYQEERDSQEVPRSPQVEPALEFLSLHAAPSRTAGKAKQITLQSSARRMLFGSEQVHEVEHEVEHKVGHKVEHEVEQEVEHEVAMSTNCKCDPSDVLQPVTESKASRAMPVPSLECIGPSKRHLQLAQVPSLGCVPPMDYHLYSPRTSFLVPVIAEPPPNLTRDSCNTERSSSPVDVRNFSILQYYPREE